MSNQENIGYITAINGGVVEIYFPDKIPAINNELLIGNLHAEVQGYIDTKSVRAVVMGPTQGLTRNQKVTDCGHPIEVPVGDAVLGRMFNVFGQPIDKKGEVKAIKYKSIHNSALPLNERNTPPSSSHTLSTKRSRKYLS